MQREGFVNKRNDAYIPSRYVNLGISSPQVAELAPRHNRYPIMYVTNMICERHLFRCLAGSLSPAS